MKPAVHNASARQCTGGPSPVLAVGGNRKDRAQKPRLIEVETGVAELVNQSTQELQLAWRQLHRTGPPLGLSRDLLIRGLAHQLQERTHGGASGASGASGALRRRLQSLAREFQKGGASFDPGIVLKSGTTLVRQWRGHTHIVLVREDGFEYGGLRYRSLTVIAKRITGAHWSGPRFFGLTKRSGDLVGAGTGR